MSARLINYLVWSFSLWSSS